jgi:hypothetical protein
MKNAQSFGWIDNDASVDALIMTLWAISIGQGIFSNTLKIDCAPRDARDIFVKIAKSKEPIGSSCSRQDAYSRDHLANES